MAKEEDDDFTFGDFSSASFTSPPPSNPIPFLPSISTNQKLQNNNDDDDEWGDFVKTPPSRSTIHTPHLNPLHPSSFDSQNGSAKSFGSSLKGPLPLSLFGDIEDEEVNGEDEVAKVSPPSGLSSKKSGFNDIIADLYSYDYGNTSNVNYSSNNNENKENDNGYSFDLYGKGLNLDSKDLILERKSVNKGSGNWEGKGENGSSFDFYGNGSNLDSKDLFLEKKSLDGVNEGNGNGEGKGKNGSSFDFYGNGSNLDSKDLILERKKDGVTKGNENGEGKGNNGYEFSGNVKSSSSNVDGNVVKGFDFSGWGLELSENNSRPNMGDEGKQGQVENDGFSYDSNRVVSSANASTSNTSAFGFDFDGWGKDSNGGSTDSVILNHNNDVNGLMGSEGMSSISKNTGLDGNGKGGDMDGEDEEEDDGWEFKGAFSESKGSHGIDVALNSNYNSNSPNKGASLTCKNEVFDGRDNNGNNHNEIEGWDFQGTSPEENAGHTIDKVVPSIREPSNTSTYSTGFSKGSNSAVNLFAISDGLNNLFPTGSGGSIDSSNLVQKSNNLAAPINFTPNIVFRSEPSGDKAQLSSSRITIEDAETDDDFGEFTAAFSETGPNRETDAKVNDIYASGTNAVTSTSLDQVNGVQHLDHNSQLDAYMPSSAISSSSILDLFSMSNGSTDLFSMMNATDGTSIGLQTDCDTVSSNAADIRGDDLTHEGSAQKSNRDGLSPHSVPESGEIEDDFSDFAAAFPEAGQVMEEALKASDPSESDRQESAALGKDLGTGSVAGDNKGALPLSLFGDEECEVDTNIQKTFTRSHSVPQSGGLSQKPDVSINDLISSLYSQAEQISSHKFIGETDSGAGPAIEVNSEPEQDIDDFNDDSWEFKDSFWIEGTSKETLSPEVSSCSIPSKLMVNDYVDFFSKLQDIIHFLIKCHLENIKKDGESAKVMAMDEEFQDELKEHVQETALTKEDGLEEQTTTDASLHELIEALKDPKLQILEAEYDLSIKLSSAEKDLKSALELKRHAKTVINLLSLGSLEDHLLYVNLWSKMISICSQELQAGGKIWKQSLKGNAKNELLFETQGKAFVKALGEIYRVAMVLGVSARLYKPWTLECSAESTQIFSLLDECQSVWSTSGLGEALSDILHSESINDNNDLPTLVESIQCIHNLDVSALKDHVFNWQESRCGLSLLTSDILPGMKMVVWAGKTYFVKLANLWANMISCDPPRVPPLHGD